MKNSLKNLLYVVPNLNKVSGGPRTRVNNFKRIFQKNNDHVIIGNWKWIQSLKVSKINLVYVESATNRISINDLFGLLILKYKSRKVVVFIRDVYFEFFSENYPGIKGNISKIANSVSNYFLTLISDVMVFPTSQMGKVYFTKNNYPKRAYYSLPPGTTKDFHLNIQPDFNRKIGILYLGSITYKNAGFEHFVNFATQFENEYNYFVLSGDKNVKNRVERYKFIALDCIQHSDIPTFIKNNNIGFAFHTRPRNEYDDLTFPIKVLDFLSFRLPFITDSHVPILELLGEDYPLYCKIDLYAEIDGLLLKRSNTKMYAEVVKYLVDVSNRNSYKSRYDFLLSLTDQYKD